MLSISPLPKFRVYDGTVRTKASHFSGSWLEFDRFSGIVGSKWWNSLDSNYSCGSMQKWVFKGYGLKYDEMRLYPSQWIDLPVLVETA